MMLSSSKPLVCVVVSSQVSYMGPGNKGCIIISAEIRDFLFSLSFGFLYQILKLAFALYIGPNENLNVCEYSKTALLLLMLYKWIFFFLP